MSESESESPEVKDKIMRQGTTPAEDKEEKEAKERQ
jgi:hypothetical protein